jgi:spermidine synthase
MACFTSGDLVAAIYVMFLASGAASLIFQVVWFKQLQFVLGSSTFAVSMTVAGFFFGLSLGSWLGGKLADGVRRPPTPCSTSVWALSPSS